MRFLRDHSLSLFLLALGMVLTLVCIPLREGTAFDLLSGVGVAFLTGGLLGFLSGPLKEVNKAEK